MPTREAVIKWRNAVKQRPCVECGETVEIPNRLLAVCEKCRPLRARRLRPRTEYACLQCAKVFYPNHLDMKFCSVQCKRIASRTGKRSVSIKTVEARRAQGRLAYHIRVGNIIRPTICEECGKECKTQGAHKDYSRPLDVRWLCRSCHTKWDHAEPKGGMMKLARYEAETGEQAVKL